MSPKPLAHWMEMVTDAFDGGILLPLYPVAVTREAHGMEDKGVSEGI